MNEENIGQACSMQRDRKYIQNFGQNNLKEKRLLRRYRHRLKGSIKAVLNEIGCNIVQ
jgi:hypothetical protein